MPAKSEKQRRMMGMALAMKRGKTPKKASPKVAQVAQGMTVEDLRDFASSAPKMKARKKGKRFGS